MKKYIKMALLIFLFLLLVVFCWFFVGLPKKNGDISFGVNFSEKKAGIYEIDWKKAYTALLEDMKVKKIRIATHWDLIEQEAGKYNFENLDWQIQEAEKAGAEVILVVGRKTPGWPECHVPNWAENEEKSSQQEKILALVENIVERYKGSSAIKYWQVENEPFFPFGECLWKDDKFLEKEIKLVKSLDSRPVIISESGEFPLWIKAARKGDIVGVTMYKKVWFDDLNSYVSYPFPPVFYKRKAGLIGLIFNKEIMCVELQAEPWGSELNHKLSLEEQEKTMNPIKFKGVIDFSRKTGIDNFYLWGAEWWYWMKEVQGKDDMWQEAKKLF
ncbi:MAG: hypothetical protein A2427_03375 [Candidatus Nealsonbacteria bacterium RIFOXYC1_FULL_40_7]|uniref:Glycoside hydrolase family 42 N-terminal domain-containing protein n=1 Tax=Candidatus Nealsonbacteria bacterium RIFOXYC1_FULL_40_7 TaxID=1801678 RepID=A0A1G2EQP2_9BACT|nr:MAG: hypothetical protein A2427_03375 [Candidatus Nealsonbacteria bacterium RIFOXYC1_FULL_40_7]OGZ28540.1 MAG: hypothetical protein A2562_03585 [Candidatus Nealsonbacteria bacterium RIFOXYD1_FULL_39_11]